MKHEPRGRLSASLLILVSLIVALTAYGSTDSTTETGLWDFENHNPSSLDTVYFEGTSGHVQSTNSSISMYVIAKDGKFQVRTSDAQFNANTYIRIPVSSTSDVVTIVSCTGYHNFTVNGVAATSDEVSHTATSSEVSQGFVEIKSVGTTYLKSVKVVKTTSSSTSSTTTSATATWDFKNVNPSSLASVSLEGTSGKVASDLDGISLYVIANYGKFAQRTSDMQMNAKTAVRVPVSAEGDIVTVTSDTGYHNYSVGGVAATADVTTHTATSTEAEQGYVVIYATGTSYLQSITVALSAYTAPTESTSDSSTSSSSSSTTSSSTATGLWDFENHNPSSLDTVYFEGTSGHVQSTNSSISMYVIAKDGKFQVRTSDAQFNSNTYLRIPVSSTSDVVTIVSCTGYHNFTVNGVTATSDEVSHTATSSEVSQGFVEIKSVGTTYLKSVQVVKATSSSSSTTTTSATATWDFKNVNPSSLASVSLEGTSGKVASTLDGISLYVIANYGKFAQRTSDIQMNAKTAVRVPVSAEGDVVTVTSDTGYHNYSVGGVAATADVTTHTATSTEAEQGYVVIYATGTSYLQSITVALSSYTAPASSSSSSDDTSSSTTDDGSYTAITKNYYKVDAGSASGLLEAISKANASSSSERRYIFLPDGTYDLGTTCLTALTGDSISIIGESMSGTIIKNAPSYTNEGIGTTATLLNKGKYNYLQDLTLENDLDYYTYGGRAVAFQDKGDYTICNRVKLKSYQDTYYSNNSSGHFYFEDCDIHGTVDFICGGGDVYFNSCTLTVEPRTKSGSGSCVIAAPYTQSSWGYVFNNCSIDNNAQSYSLARAWGGEPRVAYLNTKVNDENIISTRFTAAGMNVVAKSFKEYNTTLNGTVVSPSSNIVSFTKGSTVNRMETILSASEASGYALSKVFTSWSPATEAARLSKAKLVESDATTTTSSESKSVTLSSDDANLTGNDDFVVSRKTGAYMGYNMLVLPKGKTSQFTVTSKHSDKLITSIDFTWRIAPASGTLTSNLGTMSGVTSWTAPSGGIKSVRFTSTGAGNAILTAITIHYTETTSSSSSSDDTSSSSYDLGEPVGWATVDGSVTGGNGENPVIVTTADELVDAMSGTDAKTIYVKGTLTFSGKLSVKDAANKTVLGLPGSKLVNPTHTSTVDNTGILSLSRCKNMILRNLTFQGAGAYDIDGNDNLTISTCTYIWVDHCDFLDGVDGNFDCNNGSDNISVTWCRFRYTIDPWAGGSGGSDDHRFSDLWGGSDKNISKDGGKLRTTFANCWWDEGCRERMPRVRFGQIHIVNCLYSSSVANYCIGAGYRSNIYVENTAFTTSKTQKGAWTSCATSSGYTDYNIQLKGCYGVSDGSYRSGSQSYFNPYSYYSYSPFSASLVESVVGNTSTGAGATLQITSPSTSSSAKSAITGINELSDNTDSDATVVETTYYTMDGRQISQPTTGLIVVKQKLSNGKTQLTKKLFK